METGGALAGQVARVRAEVAALVALDLSAVDGADGPGLHRDLRTAADQLQAVAARILARVESDGRWAAGGSRTFPDWMARRRLGSTGGVRREVALGRALDGDLPSTARAVSDGTVTLEHAQVLARLAPTSEARRAALASDLPDRNEAFLLSRAAAMPVDEYRREVKRWATRVDQASAEREQERACAKEYLTFARRDDGVAIQGFVTTEHGAVLATALRAVAGVPSADDVRSREERQAAALVDAARLVLDRGLSGGGQQVRPHLTVHVSWEAMQQLAAAHPDKSAAGSPAAGGTLTEPAQLVNGEPIPRSLLARIACDSEISRVVFGPDRAVLDVGRAQRTYTGQLRRAVIARDRSCRYPGCGAPVTLGEVHHVVPWSRGGATSVRNGVLLCWFHHDLVHRRHLVIRRDVGGWTFRTTDGRTVGGDPPPTSERAGQARPDEGQRSPGSVDPPAVRDPAAEETTGGVQEALLLIG